MQRVEQLEFLVSRVASRVQRLNDKGDAAPSVIRHEQHFASP
jgi:hypothetical protein